MKKPLVLFLIGGSGARFLRSLLFQLAAGLQLADTGDIRLVLIDTDEANGNYESALRLLRQYQRIRTRIEENSEAFRGKDKSALFHHPVYLHDEKHVFLSPLDVQKRSLGNIIDYINLTAEQKDFVNLMLTRDELGEDLSIGFQGRPNMGTIGLEAIEGVIQESTKLRNLLGESPDLEAEGLQEARFFTVSSMFGGMGSSGMPMIVNKFKKKAYNNIPIGALGYMHYFKINEGKGNNDSKYFPQRTNLAYDHYKTDFSDKINLLYTIGKPFEGEAGVSYAPGKKEQKNQAHLVEFFSVTALQHFCKHAPTSPSPRDLKAHALHLKGDMQATSAGEEYAAQFENYIRLVLIAKYFTERFLKQYNTEEMKNIHWVRYANFDQFQTDEKELLQSFFTELLAYDSEELYNYSGLRLVDSRKFPTTISAVVPHKSYREHKTGIFSKRRYDNYKEIDVDAITDKDVASKNHIPRLLATLDKSFTSLYNNIYK
ncbi:hypothetical protein V9K67_19090 [Paraflavisolibacter sp. H34]|uniref:hypothetical protein n=1 Tax=Huijunlia imazamoxiresistens TaxID=3127457 RepID=UPI0030160444